MNTTFDLLISANPNVKRVLKENLTFAVADSVKDGMQFANDVLANVVDAKTILLLSGGKTPQELYAELAQEGELVPGVVGLIDERYGERMHENSNELMVKQTGLLRYLELVNVPFYSILDCHPELARTERSARDSGSQTHDKEIAGQARNDIALCYDEKIRSLFATFPKSVGILGIGLDGHTAGIPVRSEKLEVSNQNELLVTSFLDFPGPQKERITMTFLGLSMLDVLIVLVFGKEKKEALEKMFKSGSEEEIPARFFKREDIAKKSLFITDQTV